MAIEIAVIDAAGKSKGNQALPAQVEAAGKPNKNLMHEVVKAYLANQRKGTHATLTRGNVTGGGKKPWKQKHTGNARAGTSRSPLWRKGGIIHGPQPRSYAEAMPQAKIKKALWQSLASKAISGDLVVAEKPALEQAKTKLVSQWLSARNLPQETLIVLKAKDEKLALASRNIAGFDWIEANRLHPYFILRARKVVLTPEVVESL